MSLRVTYRSLARSRVPIQAPLRRAFASTSIRPQERQWSTPLAKQLFEAISTTGTVPLASYMRMCLTGDVGGYYTGAIEQGRDQFGLKGDFVTSPEISQMFGELIAVWFIAEWISQGRPKNVQLIEIGPGRGTLMDDMLRTIKSFPAMANAIDAVYMVETSKQLQQSQKQRLCGDAPATDSDTGFHSTSKYSQTPVHWAESIKAVPSTPETTPFIIAHEFFDALPIHTFQTAVAPPPKPKPGSPPSTPDPAAPKTMEWREMMVSPTPPGVSHNELGTPKTQQNEPVPEFQLTLSPGTTRHSRFLPESSPRYRALKQTEGTVVEICPDAAIYTADFAARIGGSPKAPKAKPSGAALILDYGTADTVPINSLRGIRQHKIVSPFAAPGLVDLSADVDFAALAEAALLGSEGVEVHGPICQADFLELMGIRERAGVLVKNAGAKKDVVEGIEKAWKRLVDRGPSGMGKVYKALAILPENDGRRRPVGFGGDVGN